MNSPELETVCTQEPSEYELRKELSRLYRTAKEMLEECVANGVARISDNSELTELLGEIDILENKLPDAPLWDDSPEAFRARHPDLFGMENNKHENN